MRQFTLLPFSDEVSFEDADISVIGFSGQPKRIKADGTVFFFVLRGSVIVHGHIAEAGMYGCLPGCGIFSGDNRQSCRALLVTAKRYSGMFTLGGPIEEHGRLNYIDGCTDTGLIQPPRLGDPCLNYLHFPAGTKQTPHTHPSHRIGAVYAGNGTCHVDGGSVPMTPGSIFIIPAESLHCFETADSSMRIVAFHPDSEVGPTDEAHQMKAATKIAA